VLDVDGTTMGASDGKDMTIVGNAMTGVSNDENATTVGCAMIGTSNDENATGVAETLAAAACSSRSTMSAHDLDSVRKSSSASCYGLGVCWSSTMGGEVGALYSTTAGGGTAIALWGFGRALQGSGRHLKLESSLT